MKKVLLTLIGASLLLFGGLTANAQDTSILINGEVLNVDTKPVNIDGRILIPLRSVGEALDCEVVWNNDNRAVSMSDGNAFYVMWIDKDTLFKFSENAFSKGYQSDVSPQLINEKTMVPIRCIAELMGAKVDWIDETKTVTIDYTSNANENAQTLADFGSYIIDILGNDGYDVYRDYFTKREYVVKAEIELEDGKIIKLDLFPYIAPNTVSNFMVLAKSGVYNNTIFHRVIKDFMIQGGYITTEGKQYVSVQTVIGEFITNGFPNFLPHKKGVISMARADDPNSANNQFFIVHQDSPHLNANYASFGEVTEGMEYVDEIANAKTDENDKPVENQIVKTIRILEEN